MSLQVTVESLIEWIRHTNNQHLGLLVPISGGSDSSLNLWLCAQAFPNHTTAIYSGSQLRCAGWLSGIAPIVYTEATQVSPTKHQEIQRWSLFLEHAIQANAILVGSRNKTESLLGTYSHASRVAMMLPLAQTWKSDIMELCTYVGVPTEITESSKRADPECGRPKQLADLPFQVVDTFLASLSGEMLNTTVAPTKIQEQYLRSILQKNSFKQNLPLSPQ